MPFEAALHWRDPIASHVDRLILNDAAALADGRWQRARDAARARGESRLGAAPWVQPVGLEPVELPAAAWRLSMAPVAGRHYPRLAFAGLAQGARDLRPARLLAIDGARLRVDVNHPMAARMPELRLHPVDDDAAPGVRVFELFDGPGMQTPPACVDDWLAAGIAREDERDDALFYRQPRLVHHLDAVCRARVTQLYGRFLAPGQRVLDLMASWRSHLPERPANIHVAGLGLNADELRANPRLAEHVVKDLNDRAGLPWNEAAFDLVVCTAAIEYLVEPRAVLREVWRVLKPGGRCVITFSDRWFPTKAIRLWSELHPWERLGLVLAWLRDAGFAQLGSETLRGLMRPGDDPHAGERAHADPLFAAWGVKPH
jgi:SAM-dependent methyltransferase